MYILEVLTPPATANAAQTPQSFAAPQGGETAGLFASLLAQLGVAASATAVPETIEGDVVEEPAAESGEEGNENAPMLPAEASPLLIAGALAFAPVQAASEGAAEPVVIEAATPKIAVTLVQPNAVESAVVETEQPAIEQETLPVTAAAEAEAEVEAEFEPLPSSQPTILPRTVVAVSPLRVAAVLPEVVAVVEADLPVDEVAPEQRNAPPKLSTAQAAVKTVTPTEPEVVAYTAATAQAAEIAPRSSARYSLREVPADLANSEAKSSATVPQAKVIAPEQPPPIAPASFSELNEALHDEPPPKSVVTAFAERIAQRAQTQEALPSFAVSGAGSAGTDVSPAGHAAHAPATSAHLGGAATLAPEVPETAALNGVRYLLNRGEPSVRVRLVPASLGELSIEVSKDHDAVTVRLASASPAARDALERHLPGLREAMAREGMTVTAIHVVAETSSSSPGSWQANRQPDTSSASGGHARYAQQSGGEQQQTGNERGSSRENPYRRPFAYGALDVFV